MTGRKWVRILIILILAGISLASAARLYSMRNGVQWMWRGPSLHRQPDDWGIKESYIPFQDPTSLPQRSERENAVPLFQLPAPGAIFAYISDSEFYGCTWWGKSSAKIIHVDTSEKTVDTFTPPGLLLRRATYLSTERAVVYITNSKELCLQQENRKPKTLRRFREGEDVLEIAASRESAEIAYILHSSNPKNKAEGCDALVWLDVMLRQ